MYRYFRNKLDYAEIFDLKLLKGKKLFLLSPKISAIHKISKANNENCIHRHKYLDFICLLDSKNFVNLKIYYFESIGNKNKIRALS